VRGRQCRTKANVKERDALSKAGKRILDSVREARADAHAETEEGFAVHVPDKVDVRATRKHLALSYAEFAARPTGRRESC